MQKPRILIVEDSDAKFRGVSAVVTEVFGGSAEQIRAPTINQAEILIQEQSWSVVLLDISMDISETSATSSGRGHANLGGLGVAYKMFLKRREWPTIIVTAHDAFESFTKKSVEAEIVDLNAIEQRARVYLGDAFIGHVRYGDANWSGRLAELLLQIGA